jgi:glucan phosphoethanolaminetransferase (alkaline phosphatase superfamily)
VTRPGGNDATNLVVVALWTGLVTGLVEGAGWLILQQFDRLTQLGTQIVWIAPILDSLVILAVALVLLLPGRLVPRRLWWPTALFAVTGAGAINFVSLVLGTYVYRWVLVIVAMGLATTAVRVLLRYESGALRMMRRTLPALAGTVGVLFVAVQGSYALRERSLTSALPDADAGAPDVLVVVLDALRADHLSSYGYSRPTSPFMDELAAGGVLFERAISASSYSLPSHASMLSGLFPYEHGVEWLEFKVFEDAPYPSIAEAMYDRG